MRALVQHQKMKRCFKFIPFAATALLVLGCCPAVFAQEGVTKDLSGRSEASRSSLTGAGAGSRTTAATSGGADGQENSVLEGTRHPLYRLRPSDVVEISFTVAPEFNQTLTVQPDGYIMLKDAGMVPVQGLDLAEFVEAVQNAPLDLTRLGVTEEELNSEVELLRDDDVLRKVVAQSGLGGRDWLHFVAAQFVSCGV